MSIKYYGIFTAFGVHANLNGEGLGRHLVAFLKGASAHSHVCFIIVCPSWSLATFEKLFEAEGLDKAYFKILAPQKLYDFSKFFRTTRIAETKSPFKKLNIKKNLKKKLNTLSQPIIKSLAQAESAFDILKIFFLPCFWLLLPALLISPFLLMSLYLYQKAKRLLNRLASKIFSKFGLYRVKNYINLLKEKLIEEVEYYEHIKLFRLVEAQKNILAWYSPTAFWPAFNKIKGPKLVCVPDIVLSEFPMGFSCLYDGRKIFESLESTILNGDYFVTYSETIKWRILVDHYGIEPEKITVIPHASNTLEKAIVPLSKGIKADINLREYCRILMRQAFLERQDSYLAGVQNDELKFLFYASQVRPSKNILTLLRAYLYLLRNRYIPHKLILTMNPNEAQEVRDFVTSNSLEKDVIFVPNLSVEQLAAFYKLADLVVNPSLSEGGCPFTFTEALSMNTPVIMSRISVTEEVLTDPNLQEVTFFDPYDWTNLVEKIEWALNHRQALLEIQQITYEELKKRTWTDVVNEHINLLDSIVSYSEKAESLLVEEKR